MRFRLADLSRIYIYGDADRVLVFGILIALVFLSLLYISASYEGVLFIDGGVGYLQSYGGFTTVIGDAVLLFLSRKYFDIAFFAKNNIITQNNNNIKIIFNDAINDICFNSPRKGIFYIFSFIGCSFVLSNISLQLMGYTETHWNGDVFDSPSHPLSCVTNKIFMAYSWGLVLPACAYSAIITSIFLKKLAKFIEIDNNIKYDLINPDYAGGYAYIHNSKIYFNIGISIVYLQITMLSITFARANFEHLFGYFIVSAMLIFGNYFAFHKIDFAIEQKRIFSLTKANEKTYKGDILNFNVVKYYYSEFYKNSFEKRIGRALLSIKSIAIIIPPVIKFMIKIAT